MQQRIVPHARTLRNAREQVKQMVASGVSPRRAMSYLHQWSSWWTLTAKCWTKHELLTWFLDACWDASAKEIARMLLRSLQHHASTANVEACYSSENSVLVLDPIQ